MVTDVTELEHTLNEAFELAMSGRPGPVLVDIPKDIQLAEVQFKPRLVEDTETSQPAVFTSCSFRSGALVNPKRQKTYRLHRWWCAYG